MPMYWKVLGHQLRENLALVVQLVLQGVGTDLPNRLLPRVLGPSALGGLDHG